MFRKSLQFLFIPLVLATFVSRSSSNFFSFRGFGFGAEPISNCSDDSSYFGYCEDCQTQVECSNGVEIERNNCTDEQACAISSVYSACSDISKVPDCSCPDSGTVQKPDPYADDKYIVCSNGDRHIFDCPSGETYNDDTGACEPKGTITTTISPSNICPGDENVKLPYNCTCFLLCFDTNTFDESCCEGGQIYDNETQACIDFDLFTCEGRTDGRYVDSHNCSIYYTCQDEAIFETGYCGDGRHYNVTAGMCVDGECEEDIIDCGICPNNSTYIKIDCYNYYDCVDSTVDWGQPYVPVAKICDGGTCFNVETGNCDPVTENFFSNSIKEVKKLFQF